MKDFSKLQHDLTEATDPYARIEGRPNSNILAIAPGDWFSYQPHKIFGDENFVFQFRKVPDTDNWQYRVINWDGDKKWTKNWKPASHGLITLSQKSKIKKKSQLMNLLKSLNLKVVDKSDVVAKAADHAGLKSEAKLPKMPVDDMDDDDMDTGHPDADMSNDAPLPDAPDDDTDMALPDDSDEEPVDDIADESSGIDELGLTLATIVNMFEDEQDYISQLLKMHNLTDPRSAEFSADLIGAKLKEARTQLKKYGIKGPKPSKKKKK